jgi:predicted cupin superfamily sugar epimerase
VGTLMPDPAEVIRLLGLEPHPEGGHYRETFRDERACADGRAASTAIYFLLRQGERSRWHRIDAAEVELGQTHGRVRTTLAHRSELLAAAEAGD